MTALMDQVGDLLKDAVVIRVLVARGCTRIVLVSRIGWVAPGIACHTKLFQQDWLVNLVGPSGGSVDKVLCKLLGFLQTLLAWIACVVITPANQS